jgi:hypothetical protein
MTVQAVRRPRRRGPAASAAQDQMSAPSASFAIGEIDQTIFDCPACSRPLALGARRCPGCGTRLVRGVTLGKASLFVALGLVIGLLAGSAGGLLLGLSRAAVAPPAQAATPPSADPATGANASGHPISTVIAPSASPAAASATAPLATAPAVSVPPVTAAAFGQVLAMNGRLADSRTALKTALKAAAFDPTAVAQILRSISADSIFGQQVAGQVSAWSGSSAVGAQLETFYGAVHEAAAGGLVASVRNQAAYRSAASAMVTLLGELRTVDAAVREVAGSAGVDLPIASGAPTAP